MLQQNDEQVSVAKPITAIRVLGRIWLLGYAQVPRGKIQGAAATSVECTLMKFSKPRYIRFYSLGFYMWNMCTQWQMGDILPKWHAKKTTGRPLASPQQCLCLTETTVEVGYKQLKLPPYGLKTPSFGLKTDPNWVQYRQCKFIYTVFTKSGHNGMFSFVKQGARTRHQPWCLPGHLTSTSVLSLVVCPNQRAASLAN